MKRVFVGLLVAMVAVCAGLFGSVKPCSKEDPENTKSPVVTFPEGNGPIA